MTNRLDLDTPYAGMLGLIMTFTKVAAPIGILGEASLRGPSPLSIQDRELIATYVSARNECTFCASVHGALTKKLGFDPAAVDSILRGDAENAPVSDKLKALLSLADRVREHPRATTDEDIESAKAAGASVDEIHDTVWIAASFSAFNRYVQTIGPEVPYDPDMYAERLAATGYVPEPVRAALRSFTPQG